MPKRTLHDLNPKVAEGLVARMISKRTCVSKLILAGKETQAMLVQFLRRFKVANFHSGSIFRLNNGEKFPWGDSHYVHFEDFRHIFNYGGYKPAVKITGNQQPITELLELKGICQLDLNEELPPSTDVVAKLIAQNSASLKRLTSVPKRFFNTLPRLQLEYLSINCWVSPNNVCLCRSNFVEHVFFQIPNMQVQCFEYPYPRRGYSSAFLIKRIDAEEIVVSVFGLTTSDERPFAVNSTVKRFRIQFDRVQNFDLPRLLQDLCSVYPNLEQLFLEDGLDHDDTTFVRQLPSDSDMNGILSSLQEVAGKTTFKISYDRFKRLRLIDNVSEPSKHDVFAGFKLVRVKEHASRYLPRRSRLYQKRGSIANLEFFIEFELEEKL
ncbi:hypothetical protein AAVH_31357 [Aphelenchoides avenae]|nr:hypothetical protein AAVH_31357 [Aphelenchus avenae]